MRNREDGEEQALAVVVGLLLLIGLVLMAREVFGLWLTFGISAGVVVSGYYLPRFTRWVITWHAVRRLRRRV